MSQPGVSHTVHPRAHGRERGHQGRAARRLPPQPGGECQSRRQALPARYVSPGELSASLHKRQKAAKDEKR